MAFHYDWCDREETGMIGTVSGMKTPENGVKTPENGMVGDSRRVRGAVAIVLKCSIGVNRRESRVVSLLDGSLMPRSHIPVRHPVWSRISTTDRTSLKRHETGQNDSKCHLGAISAILLPYTHRQWGSHGAGMAFITHPWRKHSDMNLSYAAVTY